MDALVKAKLAELAAITEVMRIKADKDQYWEGELSQALSRVANLTRELLNTVNSQGR